MYNDVYINKFLKYSHNIPYRLIVQTIKIKFVLLKFVLLRFFPFVGMCCHHQIVSVPHEVCPTSVSVLCAFLSTHVLYYRYYI